MAESKYLQQQIALLQQRNQLMAIQLAQSKHKQQQLKKLNEILIQNISNTSHSSANQIKLIIEGSLYNEKVIQLSAEIQRINKNIDQEVQKRVKEISKKLNKSDCQQCLRRISIATDENELKQEIKFLKMQNFNLKLKNSDPRREQLSDNLFKEIQSLKEEIFQIQEYWQDKYNQLYKQYQSATQLLSDYSRQKTVSTQPSMLRQIQHIVNELNSTRKTKYSIQKPEITDYGCFSIKDAINRPSKGLIFY